MERFAERQPFAKGWSGDKKYIAADENGNRFLLKISPAEKEQGRRQLFEILKSLRSKGASVYHPVEQFLCPDGFCTVYKWVNGRECREAITELPEARQYDYGLSAGEILKIIHSIPAPKGLPSWEKYFNAKIDRKIEMAMNCSEYMPGRDDMIEFVDSHRHLLSGRPSVFQHGDYHEGNMLIDNAGQLVVIDFEGADYGDPWEEFNRIVWTAQLSPYMAKGMLDGYFEGYVPEEFWPLLKLYILNNQLSSVPWAIKFGRHEVEKFQRQARDVLDWYGGLEETVPKWYK